MRHWLLWPLHMTSEPPPACCVHPLRKVSFFGLASDHDRAAKLMVKTLGLAGHSTSALTSWGCRCPAAGAPDTLDLTLKPCSVQGLICHVGFAVDGQQYVIPTCYGRVGETLYIHGSAVSRTLKTLAVRGKSSCADRVTRHGCSARIQTAKYHRPCDPPHLLLARQVSGRSCHHRSSVYLRHSAGPPMVDATVIIG